MTKARLRSAKASAAELTVLSKIPGVSRMLKIGTLSSDVLALNALTKSAGSKLVAKFAGFDSGKTLGTGAAGKPVPKSKLALPSASIDTRLETLLRALSCAPGAL